MLGECVCSRAPPYLRWEFGNGIFGLSRENYWVFCRTDRALAAEGLCSDAHRESCFIAAYL